MAKVDVQGSVKWSLVVFAAPLTIRLFLSITRTILQPEPGFIQPLQQLLYQICLFFMFLTLFKMKKIYIQLQVEEVPVQQIMD